MGPPTPVPLLDGGAFFESPRWHDGRWWVSDFYRQAVYTVSVDGTERRVLEVEHQPSGLGWLPDGSLLIVSMKNQRLLRRDADRNVSVHADLGAYTDSSLNDMVVDAGGRAYVGNFGFDLMSGAPLETTSLHRVDPDGTVTEVASDLWFPNGSVITPEGVLIVNETFGNRCTAFDVTPDGRLANRRTWAEFGPLSADRTLDKVLAITTVAADGGCLDAQGAWWIADALGGRLIRVAEGGEITGELHPGTPVYACALGGADGRTLYACAAPDFDANARTAAQEASLIAYRVQVPAA
jgi:sugar lactone lactonase YvrE